MRRVLRCMVIAGLPLAASAVLAQGPVAEPLTRPALAIRHPEKAVLMGAAMAGSRVVAVGERGMAIVSDDEGRTWRQVPTPVSVSLTAVRFVDDRFGVAVGHGGVVLVTSDAGNTWTLSLAGRQVAQLAMEAAKRSQDDRALQESEALVADGPDKPFLDVLALDAARVLVVGAYGLAFMSDDRGRTWQSWTGRLGAAGGLHLYAARKRGDVIVIAGEQGLVLRSVDAGRTFERVPVPYEGSFFTLELPSEGEILLAGLRGNVWRSRDEGRSWNRVVSPLRASITSSTLRSDRDVVLSTQAGQIVEWRASGSLRVVNDAPLPALGQLVHVKGHRFVALTDRGVMTLDLQASNGGNAR